MTDGVWNVCVAIGCLAEVSGNGISYCRDHACSLVNCGRRRAGLSSLCETHLANQCIEPSCGRQATLFRRCDDHRCSRHGCREPRLGVSEGCDDHTCVYTINTVRCGSLRFSDPGGQQLDVCLGHRQQPPEPQQPQPTTPPRAARRCRWPKDRCAVLEHVCGWPSCEEHRTASANAMFCKSHACEWTKGCNAGRSLGSHHCEDHRCRRCTRGREDGKRKFCHKHRHNCHQLYCSDEQAAGWKYCRPHKCRRDGCPAKRSDAPESDYCSDHRCYWQLGEDQTCPAERVSADGACAEHVCLADGCSRFRQPPGGFCQSHHKCCARDCLVERDEKGPVRWFCADHRCASAGCDKEIRDAGTRYCEHHACTSHGCAEKVKASRSPYCQRHGCASPRCPKRSGTTFCDLHRCLARSSECHEARQDSKHPYCSAHSCALLGCSRETWQDGMNHCDKHSCASDGCPFPKLNAKMLFCREHNCTTPGCVQRRAWYTFNSSLAAVCEYHICAVPTCDQEKCGSTNFCMSHICASKHCSSERLEGAARTFCESHSCVAPNCFEEKYDTEERFCPGHLYLDERHQTVVKHEAEKQRVDEPYGQGYRMGVADTLDVVMNNSGGVKDKGKALLDRMAVRMDWQNHAGEVSRGAPGYGPEGTGDVPSSEEVFNRLANTLASATLCQPEEVNQDDNEDTVSKKHKRAGKSKGKGHGKSDRSS